MILRFPFTISPKWEGYIPIFNAKADFVESLASSSSANTSPGCKRYSVCVMEAQDCQAETKYAIEIIFKGDWHLEFKPCGFDCFVPSGHVEEGFIESWGLDDNWVLWVNNDFIG